MLQMMLMLVMPQHLLYFHTDQIKKKCRISQIHHLILMILMDHLAEILMFLYVYMMDWELLCLFP